MLTFKSWLLSHPSHWPIRMHLLGLPDAPGRYLARLVGNVEVRFWQYKDDHEVHNVELLA